MPLTTKANVTFWFTGLRRLRNFVKKHLGVPLPQDLRSFAEMRCDQVFGDDSVGKRDVKHFLEEEGIGIAVDSAFAKPKVRDFMDAIMPSLFSRMIILYHEIACIHRPDLIGKDPVEILTQKLADLYPTTTAQGEFSKEVLSSLERSFAKGKNPISNLDLTVKESVAEVIK